MSKQNKKFTGMLPKEIVEKIDLSVVGQTDAKKVIAVALRNRERLLNIEDVELRDSINHKNVLMIGPTGVGKTEIVRSVIKLQNLPFVKAEATKFTEIGYVGKDVESMIRDLVENAIAIERKAALAKKPKLPSVSVVCAAIAAMLAEQHKERFAMFSNKELEAKVKSGDLDAETIDVEVKDEPKKKPAKSSVGGGAMQSSPQFTMDLPNGEGVIGMIPLGYLLKGMGADISTSSTKNVTVKEAKAIITARLSESVSDEDIVEAGIARAQSHGVVFIDEIDKLISSANSGSRGDVSREGVQRDLLPLVEGTMVSTKYGSISTNHILFVASGAFHATKVSDLIPELQGRFPVKVTLNSLTEDDFVSILTVPKYNILRQSAALLGADNINVTFTKCAIKKIAKLATQINAEFDNTGARRLHAVVEKVIQDISFNVKKNGSTDVEIDEKYVEEQTKELLIGSEFRKESYVI